MHPEHLYFNRSNLMDLINHNKRITAVGTTSARTLETIYWMGCKVRHYKNTNPRKLAFDQWEEKHLPVLDKPESLETLIEYSEKNDIHEFHVITRLMIIPGYKFHLTDRIITNFHQPRSTLLLMIGAMIGDDWRKVYTYAMNNGFRFLSYGDSSLLMP
jgi:S-adenosylmethionine:tRNA ribosyltransferase-isomerase